MSEVAPVEVKNEAPIPVEVVDTGPHESHQGRRRIENRRRALTERCSEGTTS